jgi:hypothetical protein
MTMAMKTSRIRQNTGFDISLEAAFAPNPAVVNQTTLAREAPAAKNHLLSPNWLPMLPTKITVSK